MLRLLVLALVLAGCAGGEVKGDAAPAASAWGVEGVRADGACSARVEMTLRLGGLRVPLGVVAATTAGSEGATGGAVVVDVAGVLAARCAVADGEGACGVGGLLMRTAP